MKDCLKGSNHGAGLKAKWQAGSRDAEQQQPGAPSDDAREPLLGKTDGETAREGSEKENRRGTILFLARMATADLHILLLAFTAGTHGPPPPVLQARTHPDLPALQ